MAEPSAPTPPPGVPEASAAPPSTRAAAPSVWARLAHAVQLRNPVFWMMLLVNALSTALTWVARAQPLNAIGVVLVLVFALGNAVLGMVLLWRLMQPAPVAQPAPLAAPKGG